MGPVSRIAVLVVAVVLGFGSVIATDSPRHPTSGTKVDLKEQAATRPNGVEASSDKLQSLGRAIDDLLQPSSPIPVDGVRDLVTVIRPASGPGITATLVGQSDPGKGNGTI